MSRLMRLGALAAMGLLAVMIGCGEQSGHDDGHGHGHGDDGHDHGSAAAAATPAAHTHGSPEQKCYICDASLRDPGRLWCREHTRYEDRCWMCHPELRDASRAYCEAHGAYEDECPVCLPAGTVGGSHKGHDHGDEGHSRTASGELFCNEHGVAEAECAICQPQLADGLAPGGQLLVRMPSAESAALAGIETVAASMGAAAGRTVNVFVETRLNENAMARITPLAPGVVSCVHVDLGSSVTAGETLAHLHSAEAASAKAAFLSARVDLELNETALQRESRLAEQNVSSRERLQEVEAAHRQARIAATTARQRLLNLGFTEEDVERIEREEDASATLPVRAPFAGEIVARSAVVGEAAEPGMALLTVADLSEVWLDLTAPAGAAGALRVGATLTATFDALPGEVIEARLTWIDATVDHTTRMVRARAVAPNAGGRLRAGLFGRARVLLPSFGGGVVAPEGAVQRVNGKPFVFVRVEDDLYAARRVDVDEGGSVVLAGLSAGERIATTGTYVLLTEMLKSRLGAGCVH